MKHEQYDFEHRCLCVVSVLTSANSMYH